MSTVASKRPTLYEVLRIALDTFAKRFRVAMPGRVVAFDPVKVTVDVKPLLMQWELDPDTEEEINVSLPIVTAAPLIFPGSGGFRETFPVQIGDTVLLVMGDHSIEEWQNKGNEQPTNETRTHHLTDAIAIPGLNDLLHPWTGVSTDSYTVGADGGQQIEIRTDRINITLPAQEQGVLGTTYRQNENQLNTTLSQQMAQLNSAMNQLASHMNALAIDMTTQATASVGVPLALLKPGFVQANIDAASAAGDATAAAAAAQAMQQALDQMESNPPQYLSTIVYLS